MIFLVLGSSGQIGGHLTSFLKEKGHECIEFDIVKGEEFDLRVCDNKKLEESIQKSDFVFFLAYDVGGARYLENNQDTHRFISNNMLIMSNVFESLKKHNKKFVFASSQMAYMKDSSYGMLKRLGERITCDLGGVNTRFWNVYGAEKDLNKSHVITDFILKAKAQKKIDVLTDGEELRQFLHAEDCCECLYKISKNYEDFKSGSIDISSFKWLKIKQIAEIVAGLFEGTTVSFSSKKDPLQTHSGFEPNDSSLRFWNPKISIEEGIKDMIRLLDQGH